MRPVPAVAIPRHKLAGALGVREGADLDDAVRLLTQAEYLRRADDRLDRWVPNATGTGRHRAVVLAGSTDHLWFRQQLRALRWDRRHGTGPETRWADTLRR